MKRFRDIIQDIKAPSTSDLWINNGELKYYTSNGWKAIAGNGSSDVYILPGVFQTTEGWYTTDVESIVGNWDEFIKAASSGKVIIGCIEDDFNHTIYRNLTLITYDGNNVLILVSIANYFYLWAAYKIEDDSSINFAGITELHVTQEQLAEAGFTPEICRRLNAGEVIYMSGECAGFGNDALYPIQGIAPNSSPDLVPSRLCYCHYSSYNADGTANGGCFTTIKKQSSGQYLVDYIEL